MPNWCENHFAVEGPREEMDRFVLALQTNPLQVEFPPKLTFNQLHPLPEEEKDNWYDWHVENWGTKWDIDNTEPYDYNFDEDAANLFYDFDTAWGPPIEFVQKISQDFPKLLFTLKYHEPGMAFAGFYETSATNNYETNEYYDITHSREDYEKYAEEEFGWEFEEYEGEDY